MTCLEGCFHIFILTLLEELNILILIANSGRFSAANVPNAKTQSWWELVVIAVSTFPRIVELVNVLFCQILTTWLWRWFKNETIFKSLDKLVKKHPEKVCFYFEDEQWTYKQVQEMSFQVGNYFQEKGFQKGDVVALGMTNRPEMACLWLGLSRIEVITALINYNLKDGSLQYCMSSSKCKAIIIGPEMREVI